MVWFSTEKELVQLLSDKLFFSCFIQNMTETQMEIDQPEYNKVILIASDEELNLTKEDFPDHRMTCAVFH